MHVETTIPVSSYVIGRSIEEAGATEENCLNLNNQVTMDNMKS